MLQPLDLSMTTQDDFGGTQAIRIPSRHQRLKLEAVKLDVTTGPDAGLSQTYSLPILRIGTAADNDVVLTDPTVSRHHAEIQLTTNGLMLRDKDSTNGTFIGDLRVRETYLAAENPLQTRLYGFDHPTVYRRTTRLKSNKTIGFGELVGSSGPMRELYGFIRAIGPTPATVLIQGESGCGKELIARTLHDLSGRDGPMVVFDASVADPETVRNDLFGHIKGAYTGAAGSREGGLPPR